MEYSIRENNPGDKDLIENFNKELNSRGFNFNLPQYNKELSNENIEDEKKFLISQKIDVLKSINSS